MKPASQQTRTPCVLLGAGGLGALSVIQFKKMYSLIYEGSLHDNLIGALAIDTVPPRSLINGGIYSGSLSESDLDLIVDESLVLQVEEAGPAFDLRRHPAVCDIVPPDVRPLFADRNLTTDGGKAVRSVAAAAYVMNDLRGVIQDRLRPLYEGVTVPEQVERFGAVRGETKTFLVGSLAGATGSSLILRTAYSVRRLDRETGNRRKNQIIGIFALPDVFPGAKDRNHALAYEALREFRYFARPGTSFDPYYGELGDEGRIDVWPFDRTFLVSRHNGRIELPNPAAFAALVFHYVRNAIED